MTHVNPLHAARHSERVYQTARRADDKLTLPYYIHLYSGSKIAKQTSTAI